MKFNVNNEVLRDFASRFGLGRTSSSADDENMADSIFERESEKAKRTISQFRRSKRGKGVITDDIVINGSIISGSNLVIEGVVNGDIKCSGNIEVRGAINGNVECSNAVMSGANIIGDVVTGESIVLEKGSVIHGSLKTRSAYVNGTVTGNIVVTDLVTVMKSATIEGDITAASISIAQNALINGKLNITKK